LARGYPDGDACRVVALLQVIGEDRTRCLVEDQLIEGGDGVPNVDVGGGQRVLCIRDDVEVGLAGEVVNEELGRVGQEELITGSAKDDLGHGQSVPVGIRIHNRGHFFENRLVQVAHQALFEVVIQGEAPIAIGLVMMIHVGPAYDC